MSRTVFTVEKLRSLSSNNTRNRLLLEADKNGIIKRETIFGGDDIKAIIVNNEERTKDRQHEKIKSIYSYIDTRIDDYIRQGGEIDCKKGCCDCCKQYFHISIVEYREIRKQLLKMDDDVLQYIFDTAVKADNKLKKIDKKCYDAISSSANNENHINPLYLFDDNVPYKTDFSPCPLCLKDGSCAVYKDRPIVCRLFGVISQMQGCEKINKNNIGMSFDFAELGKSDSFGLIKDVDYVCNEVTQDGIAVNNINTYFQSRPIFKWILFDGRITSKVKSLSMR